MNATVYRMLIGGELRKGTDVLEVINPSTGVVGATCPRASLADLNDAVNAAASAFPAWSAAAIETRQLALVETANVIERNADQLARILTFEQGKPLADARQEVLATANYFRYFSSRNLPVDLLEEGPNRRIERHRKAIGVVGAIVPWNFPLLLMAFKVPPALLAGNTVVLKPAATTPLATLKLGELVSGLYPPGVLNIIADANDLGAAMTKHSGIQKISFTGSTETGIRVMASAAQSLKRVTLELGGNDAAIVLSDVDPKAIAPKLFQNAFANNGQICIAIKRLYVHTDIYDDLCSEIASLADAAVLGDGLSATTQFGPVQNRVQYDKLVNIIEDARRAGTIIAGGIAPSGPGYFIRPTVVRDIEDGTQLVDTEQFGPVLPIIRFTDPSDAVRRANQTPYGLGASVWSDNAERAYEVAAELVAGTVWINTHRDLLPEIPFGGVKLSGLGIELGEQGLAEFTQQRIVHILISDRLALRVTESSLDLAIAGGA